MPMMADRKSKKCNHEWLKFYHIMLFDDTIWLSDSATLQQYSIYVSPLQKVICTQYFTIRHKSTNSKLNITCYQRLILYVDVPLTRIYFSTILARSFCNSAYGICVLAEMHITSYYRNQTCHTVCDSLSVHL